MSEASRRTQFQPGNPGYALVRAAQRRADPGPPKLDRKAPQLLRDLMHVYTRPPIADTTPQQRKLRKLWDGHPLEFLALLDRQTRSHEVAKRKDAPGQAKTPPKAKSRPRNPDHYRGY